MTEHAFYECPKCGFFHPAGFTGDCGEQENRYDLDLLDERFPDNWQEVDAPGADKPEWYRLTQLTPETDLNGNRLEVGCNARLYTWAHYRPDTDTIGGIALNRPGDAMDGILEAIGEVTECDPVPHYIIRCGNEIVRPYVNGQPINRCVESNARGDLVYLDKETCPQFAVFRL